MKFRYRALARAGATALLASGVFATAGAPASAAGTQTDFELSVVGTKVGGVAEGKLGWAKITNKGTGTPSKLSVTADLSKVDSERIVAMPMTDGDCRAGERRQFTCEIAAEDIPGPGETLEVPVFVIRGKAGQTSYHAPVTFTINSPDDTNESNNSKTIPLMISGWPGVDLGVLVPDVKAKVDSIDDLLSDEEESLPKLRAGDRTLVAGFVFNWGDQVAAGLQVKVKLPKQVTFAETEDDCDYSADKRTATCTYRDFTLMPESFSGEGDLGAVFYWPVRVAEDVEGPVTLAGGSWTVNALGQAPVPQVSRSAAKPLPKNAKMVSAEHVGADEVDFTDNVDDFAVVVAGAGNGGGGGGLPVTGVQAGLIGGIGVAVVVAGGVMFLLARRRRVVLVTPGDEKPND
ncbi:hypothetical protein [Micromonospora polyrhachis]|uniref:LPXTG-motif cell wall anchor domain-containing protein n=1 Tax=Micromonospora polyrhachis TaxID=1282883 RepID=A0A7W7WPH5_9ACTN|nr:hypothetical protein [Micromonospora polyrhachis]MBB4958562.1 hypothetical protein [Micromonospora polyrhachis]